MSYLVREVKCADKSRMSLTLLMVGMIWCAEVGFVIGRWVAPTVDSAIPRITLGLPFTEVVDAVEKLTAQVPDVSSTETALVSYGPATIESWQPDAISEADAAPAWMSDHGLTEVTQLLPADSDGTLAFRSTWSSPPTCDVQATRTEMRYHCRVGMMPISYNGYTILAVPAEVYRMPPHRSAALHSWVE